VVTAPTPPRRRAGAAAAGRPGQPGEAALDDAEQDAALLLDQGELDPRRVGRRRRRAGEAARPAVGGVARRLEPLDEDGEAAVPPGVDHDRLALRRRQVEVGLVADPEAGVGDERPDALDAGRDEDLALDPIRRRHRPLRCQRPRGATQA
jgi:hypothetical protein